MKKNCPLCKLDQKKQDELWTLFHESDSAPNYSSKDLRTHFMLHRAHQPYLEKPLSGKESLAKGKKLPQRSQNVLLLLLKNPGLCLEQISSILYLDKKPETAIRSASRDMKRLMLDHFVYRVFLENVSGDGPRPRHDVPALYFLGVNSRSLIRERTGKNPIKREEWISSDSDLDSWNNLYNLYLSREIPTSILSHLELAGAERQEIFDGWEVSFHFQNWISPFHFSLHDPLRNFSRIYSDGLFALSFQDLAKTRSALLPIFYYLDREVKPLQKITDQLLSHTAIPRSRVLEEILPGFTRKTIAPVLCITKTPERRDAILEKTKGSYPDSAIIIASQDSLKKDINESAWIDLFHKGKTSILKSSLMVAGSSAVAGGNILQEKPFP